MAKIDISGVEHDYEITPCQNPSDITLVFIHGWLLSREYWHPIISEMSSDFTCLCYDLRGFGQSNILPQTNDIASPSSVISSSPNINQPLRELGLQRSQKHPFSPAAYAHDLLSLLDKLQVKNPWLIGHSLGGTIAVWAAAMASHHNIQGLVCINSGGGIYVADEFAKFRTAGSQILKYRPQWLAKIPGMDWIFSRSNVATAVERRWGKQLLTDFLNVQEIAGRQALLESTTREEVLYLPQIMQRLTLPTYFIAGEKDKVMEPKYVKHLASFHETFSQSESNLFQLKNCGHLSIIEQPHEVAQILDNVLGQHCPQAISA